MNHQINLLEDSNTSLISFGPGFSFSRDLQALNEDLFVILDNVDAPLSLILDTTNLDLDFDTLVNALNAGEPGTSVVIGHPDAGHRIIVTGSNTLKIVGQHPPAPYEHYNEIQVTVVSTLEEALDAIGTY